MSYYIRIKGKIFGPFEESQLLAMKSKGKLLKQSEISEDKNNWHTAESLTSLFSPIGSESPSKPAEWFYSVNGTEGYGPITAAEIRQMILSGQLNLSSYVWKENENARLIKNEPVFSPPHFPVQSAAAVGAAENLPAVNDMQANGSGSLDAVQLLQPLQKSLGWLMFLKIVFLLSMFLGGLGLLIGNVMLISSAIASDSIMLLMTTFLAVVLNVCVYVPLFISFLQFWKYHTLLNQAAAAERITDLVQANHVLYLFWKWFSISLAVQFTAAVVVFICLLLAAGFTGNILGNVFGDAL